MLALRFCFLEPIIPLPFGDFQGAEANEKVDSLKVPLWFLPLADHPEVPKFKALLCRTQVERERERAQHFAEDSKEEAATHIHGGQEEAQISYVIDHIKAWTEQMQWSG